MGGGVRDAGRPLSAEQVRWRCDAATLGFASTAEVEPVAGVIGQDAAVEALRFGLDIRAPGQNVFVRGLAGTGRLTLVRQLMEELRTVCRMPDDRCYVHDFRRPHRPRLITLPAGRGRIFRRRMDRFCDFIRDDLKKAVDSPTVRASRTALEQQTRQRLNEIVVPFESALRQAGLALAQSQAGAMGRPAIVPLVEGQPVAPEALEQAVAAGRAPTEALDGFRQRSGAFQGQLESVAAAFQVVQREHEEWLRRLYEGQARSVLEQFVSEIASGFPDNGVGLFLKEVVDDVLEHRLGMLEAAGRFVSLYRVNVVLDREESDDACAIVAETAPTTKNLLGTIDREVGSDGQIQSAHMMIRAGSLLRADSGFLILDARDVLAESGAWKALTRTLKTGKLEIATAEPTQPWTWPSPTPEPIPIDVKVVLIGDHAVHAMLEHVDPDFRYLFKVLVDFDDTIERTEAGVGLYAGVLARIARDEDLPAFSRDAVGALAEHGARIASRRGRLTARFGRVADIAREAAHLSRKSGRTEVEAAEVRAAVGHTRARASLPSRKFRERVADGTLRIRIEGEAVGQINGLAVLPLGELTYGFPARITATIGPGTAGLINIEREAALSGAIHTKSFYILGGVLRSLLKVAHPLTFNASIAFEQSYGAIDGDSAGAAEICCLLSAMTEIPLRQDLAMTGAVDQLGNVLAVGSVNEKIEGFYDLCHDRGLTGRQGVVIPLDNAGDLMVRDEVAEAVAGGTFHVWAVSTVPEALEILADRPAGTADERGRYPEGTVLGVAMRQAEAYWRQSAPASPGAARGVGAVTPRR